jgi:hypothetical protein
MNKQIRKKLDMAGRVGDFSRQHMSTDPSYAAVLNSFETRLARGHALVSQQRAGQVASRTAAARQQEMRRALHEDFLPYLVRVGQVVAKTSPDLVQGYEMPTSRHTNLAYRTAARAMFDQAVAARDKFIAAGMTELFLTDLGEALDQYDAAVEDARQARIGHVGARADLEVVTEELMELVALLDGLNRYRFRHNAELSAAWESARNVVARPQPKPDEPGGQAGGNVQPAA